MTTSFEKDLRESAKIAGECWKSAKKRLAEKRQARAKVHKRSRAKRDGTVLRCPKCNSTEGNRVYHFSWSAITCQNCHEMVNKYDWDQEDT
jgi:uncharacterized protein (DUF983 family)